MKKFQFRLEAFRRYKQYLEQQAQLEVAGARNDVLACEERISHSRREFAETLHLLDEETDAGIEARRYLLYNGYLSGIESRIDQETRQHHKLEKVLKKKQTALSKKSVERKVLDNLKSRRREEYYENQRFEEQKETDDGIITRKAREINS